ncbi:DUF6207 family protein [Streptomyces sp. NPDC051214]|uniref:DUF6207 family protein n=1 Tax=Streptomyces sp. NPDC051214 TaxID=3155282 RepID=UPI0034472B1E
MSSCDVHLKHPGCAQITIHAADGATATALAYEIAAHLNATGPSAPHRLPGEEGAAVQMTAYATPPGRA